MTSLLNALVRPEIAPLPVYNAGLSDAAVRTRYGVTHTIRLGSNENPFGPSPRVAQALTALAAHVSDYPDAHATQLRQALAEGTGMAEERLVFGNGSEELIKLLCEIFLQPSDVVVTQRPVFGLHQIYPEMMGAKVRLLNLSSALGFDVPAWCEALRTGPKLAFLPNPSNPVGCMVDADAMARLLAATPETTLLVIDEAYYEYARLADGYPDVLAQLATRKGPWMVLRTFSKAWGLAGLRVGYGLASSAELAALIDRVRTPFNLNSAAQHAALAAWQDAPHMQRSVVQTVQLREALAQRLQTLAAAGAPLAGLRIAPSVANFLFLDLGRPAAPIAQALLAQGIIVKPWKEDGYTRCLRVSIGQATDNEAFMHALVQAFGQEQA